MFPNSPFTLKPFFILALLLTVAFGQSRPAANSGAAKPDEHPNTQALYEEAKTYVDKKYEDFNRRHVSFDPKLEASVRQEQKELAARNAAIAAQFSPAGNDLYYLGLLYHLAGDSDATLATLRRFLSNSAPEELAQVARSAIVVNALRKGVLADAESTLTEYQSAQPQDQQELFDMESLVTEAFYKERNFERTASHAQAMFNVAKKLSQGKVEPFKRDEMLFKSVVFLSEAQRTLGKKEFAISSTEDLLRIAISLPSGSLYKRALNRLWELDSTADPLKGLTASDGNTEQLAPELVPAKWIGRPATTLAALRGHVVLLDFWATWCGPCRFTFPKLRTWQQKYHQQGLEIIGLTTYAGAVGGHKVGREQELAYLQEFKQKNHLDYPFAVADSQANDVKYSVYSIPMSFLIDRRGRVRFIAAGAGEDQSIAMGKMIKRLLDEPQ